VVQLADQLLVGAHAGRTDFGNLRVADDREAHVDRPGARAVLQVVNRAQADSEREDARPRVIQARLPVALLVPAEGERAPDGPVQRVDDGLRVRPQRNDVDVPAGFRVLGDHVRLEELIPARAPLMVADEEGEDVAFLQLAHDVHRDLRRRRRAHNGREPGHPTIDELNPQRAQDRVGDEAVPRAVVRLGAQQVAEAVVDLLGDQRRDPGIQRVLQVWQPQPVGRRHRRAEVLAQVLQDRLQLVQLRDLLPEEGVDHREVVRRLREADRLASLMLLHALPVQRFGSAQDVVSAPHRSLGNNA